MSKKEITEKIERIEKAMFIEEMADFMDWARYYELKRELAELKAQL